MTTLTIRNVDAAIKERKRAARNGRSMEAELRQILSETLAPTAAAR
jgi:plasmid stability protein